MGEMDSSYYLKRSDIMVVEAKNNSTWIMRKILAQRDFISQNPNVLNSLITRYKFHLKTVYHSMKAGTEWVCSRILHNNNTHPHARFILWLECHKCLATKSRLVRLGFLANSECALCKKEEIIQHLFFECVDMNLIWPKVLPLIQVDHTPEAWDEELNWCIKMGKGKGWRASLFKIAVVETIYCI